MKKTILMLTLLTLSSSFAYSEEASEPELMEASENYVISLVEVCKNYAIEDEVDKENLNAYLLTCVNDELESSYYKPIKVLPKN
tara:strand:+ start:631 stop:882 length:252 start_codon:yes stop_codon:yes gene_type:complete